jgi:uncharacterized protein (DUF488 family)
MRDNESYVKVGAVKCRTCMPRSRFSQFNALALDRALRGQGTGYASFGAALGGRPEDRSCYDAEGHVRYDRLAATPSFLGGIERLEKASRHRCVALLCAEEAPERCHRHLLIARVLVSRGGKVAHLRHDGTEEPYEAVVERRRPAGQQALFGVEAAWRSVRALRGPRRPIPGQSAV